MDKMAEQEKWDKVIRKKSKLFDLRLKRVWDYRDLIQLFVKRDVVVYYKQTILGPLWFILQPVISSIMYMLVFGTLAKIGTDGIPQILFYFSGTMLWNYFSETLIQASNVFINNKGMFGKIYFPRLVVPISTLFGQIIKFLIQFVLFAVLFIYFMFNQAALQINVRMLLLPVIIIWIGILATGSGLIISSITTKYRDLALVLNYLVSLLMYASPVVYPLSEVPQSLQKMFMINPVSAPIELFRTCFFGTGNCSAILIVTSLLTTTIILFLGLILFNRNEQTFVDTI